MIFNKALIILNKALIITLATCTAAVSLLAAPPDAGAPGPARSCVYLDHSATSWPKPPEVVDAVETGTDDDLREELGDLPREEKPWIRELAGELVAFCRSAQRAPDILFAWSL